MEVSSQKLPFVRMLPQGFLFLKINIPEIVRHAHFGEASLLLIFGENIHPDTQEDSQETVWKLSGSPPAALRRLPEGIPQLSGGN